MACIAVFCWHLKPVCVCIPCSCGRRKVKTTMPKQRLATKPCHLSLLVSWTVLNYDCSLISSYVARRPFLYVDGASCERAWSCGWWHFENSCAVLCRWRRCYLDTLFLRHWLTSEVVGVSRGISVTLAVAIICAHGCVCVCVRVVDGFLSWAKRKALRCLCLWMNELLC